MKQISTYYSDDDQLKAEVYIMDEITYMIEKYGPGDKVSRVYVNTMGQADNIAEDFVMGVSNESSSVQ